MSELLPYGTGLVIMMWELAMATRPDKTIDLVNMFFFRFYKFAYKDGIEAGGEKV